LVPEKNVFLFTLVSQAKHKLGYSAEQRANFGEDVTYNPRRFLNFAGLQKHNIDPRFFDSRGCLEDLCLVQFEDRIPAGVVATHRAEVAVDPAKIRNFHQAANDDTIPESNTPSMPGSGKQFLLPIIFRLKPSR
jgi:hypothetical protein